MKDFNALLESIYAKSPLQKKKLAKHLAKRDQSYFREAQKFCQDYFGFLDARGILDEEAVNAYLKLCQDMFICQVEFMKTGKYPVALSTKAYDDVYNNKEAMTSYMIGLAISQFLWETHYDMFSFLDSHLKKHGTSINSYLEIGPGHGLFLNKALAYLNEKAQLTAVDISPTSIDITKSIIEHFWPGETRVEFHNCDMLDFEANTRFDFITMGEVLEHVNYPEKLLNQLRSLLNKDGRAFVSTCVDAPAIDHVHHFKSVDEIRDLFNVCDLKIREERVLPVEDLPLEEIVARRITINYCAILEVSRK